MRFRYSLLIIATALLLPACDDGGGTAPTFLPDGIPGSVAASPLSTSSAQVTWTDTSSNEANFLIQTSPDDVVWTDAILASAEAEAAVVSGLTPGVLTYFKVLAVNAKGQLGSTSVSITPPAPAWLPTSSGPDALFWASSAYDSLRDRMVVYGGRGGSTLASLSGKLWSLDPGALVPTWSELVPAVGNTPPAARAGASLIYDPLGDRLIMFGGQAGGGASNSELWEFRISTAQWFPLFAFGMPPSARIHHTAVHDPDHDRMILFGGDSAGFLQSEVRTLSLPLGGVPEWSTLPTSGGGPTARKHHSAIYDGDGRRMIVFAGLDNELSDFSVQALDVWALDLTLPFTATWEPLSAPGGPSIFRDGQMAVWDSVNGQMLVFGGGDDLSTPLDELWTLNLRGTLAWRQLNSIAPAPGSRQYGTAVFDPVNARMVIFGGTIDDFLTSTDETYRIDF